MTAQENRKALIEAKTNELTAKKGQLKTLSGEVQYLENELIELARIEALENAKATVKALEWQNPLQPGNKTGKKGRWSSIKNWAMSE